jgi:hypothetical protein
MVDRLNDLLFRRWYNERVVRFVGGPLHGEVMMVDGLMNSIRYPIPPVPDYPFKRNPSPASPMKMRMVKYDLMRDFFVFKHLGCSPFFFYFFHVYI